MWAPAAAQIEQANLTAFARRAVMRWKLDFNTYPEFYAWSVGQPAQFWESVWDFCGVIAAEKGERVLVDGDRMPGAKWFPDARLNFAENMLRRRDNSDAFVFWDENGFRRRMTHASLYDHVSRVAQAMRAEGLSPGDRVAAFIPNLPETAVFALAAISIGAVWSSCSPDFGADGVLDRFGQIGPTLLFCADGYLYNGKTHDSTVRVREIAARLPQLRRVVVVQNVGGTRADPEIARAVNYEDWIAPFPPQPLDFAQLPFDHPLYILFTSGTTGKPKCIVHGAGGALLAGIKTYKLQYDVKPLDRFFYYTTCNWVMWNLLFHGLLAEASVMLYDGSPFMRDANILFDYCDAERFTQFGTSAKFIDAIAKRGMQPLPIVDRFQEFADAFASMGQIAIFVAEHFFILQRLHERFAGRVVPRVALARHADFNAVGFEQIPVIVAGVLRAAVGMMHQAGLDCATRQRHA